MQSVDLGMGVWCYFRDLDVNKSNTRDIYLKWKDLGLFA